MLGISGHWELVESTFSPLRSIMSAFAAHVVQCVLAPVWTGGKNWLIVEFVLAIYSVFLGLPTFLPVLTYLSAGLFVTRIASLLAIRFYIWIVSSASTVMPWSLSSLSQSRMCWSFSMLAYFRMSWQPERVSHFSICSRVKRHLCL